MRVALLACLLAGAAVARGQTVPAPDAAFPPAPEREVVLRVCSGCHATEAIARQRLEPADWQRVVAAMAAQGAQGTDAEFDAIAAYLARSFPPAG